MGETDKDLHAPGGCRERASTLPTKTVKRVQTMKFPHLQPGQRFRWRDQIYSKTGPLTAVAEADGNTRMFSRSAIVTPLDGSVAMEPVFPSLTPDQVREALDTLASRLEEAIQAISEDVGVEHTAMLRRAVAEAREGFIEQTGI